ncbi:MAG: DegT/DnrJ/EryC1/StrS aminotransferase family protein [Methanosarcinales archaeon]|nr:DegT/DnrJ/EryC1/StrS aminotransferase family protein [ANME-2 cluster archaeon]MDW7776636.1 DegT/DnrJ/EryC1/StrS aminotransferase family protein [Methanosarcinales archaeon]
MIPIARPIIGDDEIHAVTEVMRSGVIAEGSKVADFENTYSKFIGVSHAIAVNSGTAALQIALQAAGIGKGDEIVTSSFSFIATANSVLYTGARPVFADISPDTFNIDPDAILNGITPRTKALLPVHLYGHPAEMKTIMEIAEDKKLHVIEDACQAHGAMEQGKHVGSFGIGTFSFYPTKNMTTSEGGMITTNDTEIDAVARMLRSHGSKQRYHHEMLGYNFRMTDISAAIGQVQLTKLDNFNQKRMENAGYLSAGLKGLPGIETPQVRNGCTHVFHQYTIRVTEDCRYERDQLVTSLGENGIGTGIYYPIPIHKQPLYIKSGYTDSLKNTEIASKQVISLPVHPSVSREELDHIITTLGELTG